METFDVRGALLATRNDCHEHCKLTHINQKLLRLRWAEFAVSLKKFHFIVRESGGRHDA